MLFLINATIIFIGFMLIFLISVMNTIRVIVERGTLKYMFIVFIIFDLLVFYIIYITNPCNFVQILNSCIYIFDALTHKKAAFAWAMLYESLETLFAHIICLMWPAPLRCIIRCMTWGWVNDFWGNCPFEGNQLTYSLWRSWLN